MELGRGENRLAGVHARLQRRADLSMFGRLDTPPTKEALRRKGAEQRLDVAGV